VGLPGIGVSATHTKTMQAEIHFCPLWVETDRASENGDVRCCTKSGQTPTLLDCPLSAQKRTFPLNDRRLKRKERLPAVSPKPEQVF
jgi:hypothetical protein